MADYEYDVFLSYRRAGSVNGWMHNHFYPKLVESLTDELNHWPEIYLDTEQDVGDRWPQRLEYALLRSRIMLCVWTPSYFGSDWCLAEWESMKLREQALGMANRHAPGGLVYPIRLKDGDSFPKEAQETQYLDMKPWAYSSPVFQQSVKFLEFEEKVAGIAEDLAGRLRQVPTWEPHWTVIRPAAKDLGAPALPRL